MEYKLEYVEDGNLVVQGTPMVRELVETENFREMGIFYDYNVLAVVVLSENDFDTFSNNMLEDYDFFKEVNKVPGIALEDNVVMIEKEGVDMEDSSVDNPVNIIVDTQGYTYARYTSVMVGL